MPYDPDDLYTAEPKLLSIDCFPTFFSPPAPPDYDLIMAENTRYHRLSDQNRVSMESAVTTGNPDLDAGMLLLDPTTNDDGTSPPKKEYKLACHPTFIFRILTICLLIPSLVIYSYARRGESVPAIVFVCITIIRNIFVVLHYILSKHLLIRVEFRNASPNSRSHNKPYGECPDWATKGLLCLLIDMALAIVLLITAMAAMRNADHWHWRNPRDACIIAYVASVFYFLSAFDMGKPSNILVSGSISFNYGRDKKGDGQVMPQVYRDVEAAGGLGVQSHKTGADSPVII